MPRRPAGESHRYVFTVYAVDTEKLGPDSDARPPWSDSTCGSTHWARAQLIGEYAALRES